METSEYKEVFLNEAREYLSVLNNALVLLERDPGQSGAVHEIFRAAHTLKGMSATMGYEPMARLTHQMEAVLEPVRSGARGLTARLVDALFVCLDHLERWVNTLTTRDFIEEEGYQAAVSLLKEAASTGEDGPEAAPPSPGGGGMPPFTEEEREVLSQARAGGFSILRIDVELDPACAFKEVRSFMILKNLHELGEIVKSHPTGEEIEKGRFDRGFSLALVTDRVPEELEKAVRSVSEVRDVRIQPFREEASDGARAVPKDGPASAPGADKNPASFSLPTIRVHTSKLEKLMELVQELVISKTRFEQVAATKALTELSEPLSQLHHITDELQDEIMRVRLIRVRQVFERFPRMVRDLARSLGKKVDLEMEGADVEIDRTVIEEMSEPLLHLLRNAIDHGIEAPEERLKEGKEAYGRILLEAKRERNHIVLSVSDDGRGVDPERVRRRSVAKGLIGEEEAGKLTDEEAVRLIALPGFSTMDKATEVSGRGVGVDVAKTKVEKMGGTFRILSRKGTGTTFLLRFPLTLAILKALLVRCSGETFAVPVTSVLETVEVLPSEKRIVQQQEAILLRDEVVPVYRLQELLEMEPGAPSAPPEGLESILICDVGEARVGIQVDAVVTQQEIAIKSLDRLLRSIRGFSGATILGDGRIALILDTASLVEDLKERRFQAEHAL